MSGTIVKLGKIRNNVDVPPFPDKTNITCRILDKAFLMLPCSKSFTCCASGDENFPEEHAFWLGHPSQADDFPASSDDGPTHPSLASEGASEGLASVILNVECYSSHFS